ncbi:hypothetical protein [Clostridium tetani]|uniref:Uncharacterized protein n=1 Tax=Clostridium tetani TaxID=1513 RepID=A0ABY0ES94_CLOTA|nr:hypothetical protein [Clostridium tetani]KHO40384.1 hypothetical protein OR62_00610 [Clostridium tetani]RXI40580.1 hypothetical protein DP129_03460 [Clostridium tetani]RXI58276.1 hypothetical protein DP131_02315 [Clostridium tetani]RXI70588.1 hypothetical protein DQN76_06200 [Clostridium tetani]
MDLNKKILKFGLLLIIISLIFTIILASVYKLKNPVFLKMFVEKYVYVNEDSSFVDGLELKYITNISDNRKVIDINFKEQPNIEIIVSHNPMGYENFSFFDNNNSNKQIGDIYGRYIVNTIYLNINNLDKKFNEIELNNAKVSFDDGSTLDSNLGRIILYKDKNNHEDIVEHISSSGSSDGTSSSDKKLKKDIKLLNVESPLLDDLKDYFDISIGEINYKDISGVKYEKDKVLSTHSKFKTPKSIFEEYSFYDINPKLYYEDIKGNKSYIRIYNINHTPYNFDLKGMFKYLKSRSVI